MLPSRRAAIRDEAHQLIAHTLGHGRGDQRGHGRRGGEGHQGTEQGSPPRNQASTQSLGFFNHHGETLHCDICWHPDRIT
jgi:hypothetical protein